MIFLILTLSCTLKELRVKEKGIREDISRAIQNSNEEDSRDIIEKIDRNKALQKNKEGLLPVEEAIEAGNIEAVEILINLDDCEYPYKIYEKIVDTGSVDMFKLISQRKLDYRLLLRIKENEDKELEREFLKRIEVTELERFILSGEIGEIKKKGKEWIVKNYKDDQVNQRGISTTEISCIYGGTDFIKEIVEILGKDITDIKENLLFTVSKLGEKGAVECLLDLGIDVQKLGDGMTALMAAADRGSKEVCELLIKKGADVNASLVTFGTTALMIAAVNGEKEVCQLLIDNDADINASAQSGWTALMSAAENGHKEVCELLIDNDADVNATDKYGETVLMYAVKEGYKEVCELLIEKGAEVNVVGKDKWTALIFAAENGHKEVCELLIEKGADVNALEEDERTVLMIAADEGYKEVCELLIEKGADINAKKQDGKTALMYAAEEDHKEVCELLIEKGADVNAVEEDEWTALMFAAQNGHKEVCELLIEKGADVNATDKVGKAALMTAAENGYSNIVELFISHGAQFDQMYLGIKEDKLVTKLKSCRDKILHLDNESLTKGKTVGLVKILEKKIVKGENVREILEDIRRRRNNSWKDAAEELVKLIINRKGEDIERRLENERIEKLLIRNCLMREVIEIEEESKKRKYEEDIERCVRNKKES